MFDGTLVTEDASSLSCVADRMKLDELIQSNAPLDDFDRLPNPFPIIIVMTGGCWVLIGLAVRLGLLEFIDIHYPLELRDLERVIFIWYLALYGCWWTTYLTSNRGDGARSLRSLLHATSGLFANAPWFVKDDVVKAIDTKASATVGGLSMLVSASFVSLTLLLQIYERSLYRGGSPPFDDWQYGMMALAGGVGFMAFMYLLVAADALDTVHNLFEDETRYGVKRWAYRQALTRRYAGLALLIAQIACGAACFVPLYGTVGLAAALTVGYSYWFGSVKRADLVAVWGRFIGVILFGPLIMLALVTRPLSPAGRGVLFTFAACGLWALTMPMVNTAIERVKGREQQWSDRLQIIVGGCIGAHIVGFLMAAAMAMIAAGTQDLVVSAIEDWRSVTAGLAAFGGTAGFCVLAILLEEKTAAAMLLTRTKVPLLAAIALAMFGATQDEQRIQVAALGLSLAAAGAALIGVRREPFWRMRHIVGVSVAVITLWIVQEVFLAIVVRNPSFAYSAGVSRRVAALAAVAAPENHALMRCGTSVAVAAMMFWAMMCGVVTNIGLFAWRRAQGRRDMTLLSLLSGKHQAAPWLGLFVLYGALGQGLAYTLFGEGIHALGLARANLIASSTTILGLSVVSILYRMREPVVGDHPVRPVMWMQASLLFAVALLAVW